MDTFDLQKCQGALSRSRERFRAPDPEAYQSALAYQGRLTKPPGSLGRLEALGARLAGIYASMPPAMASPAAVAVFAGDHGVLEEGVSPWPVEVTGQMVRNFVAGGAAINAFARQVGAGVVVVDVGVATPLDDLDTSGSLARLDASRPVFIPARVRPGTANLAREASMTEAEALQAVEVGAGVAEALVGSGARCLATGDMGIGNTTPAAALVGALCGADAESVTGLGTGIDDDTWRRKVGIVGRALDRLPVPEMRTPLGTLAEVGGLEIAAIAGYCVAGASLSVPVILDGVIALAGALVARSLMPEAVPYWIAGHRSTEPGASLAMEELSLEPLLDLGMRLGEGTGACLAIPLVQAAARVLNEMATFDSAGVAEKPAG